MSYDIELRDEQGNICHVEKHSEGGTYVLDGTTDAYLNITFNYSEYYSQWIDKESGLKWLNGKRAKECIETLKSAIRVLGIYRDDNYWGATPGNAGYALSILLRWAEQYPDAIFTVSC